MNNLLTRVLAVGLAAILCFALVTAFVVKVGFRSVVERADRLNGEQLTERIRDGLRPVRAGERGGPLGSRVEEALRDLPVRTEYLAVLDEFGSPVYLTRKERAVDEAQWPAWRKQLRGAHWQSVRTADSTLLSFAFKTVHIDMEKSSQAVIAAIERIAFWAAAIAAVVSAIVAFLVSRPLSLQARRLSGALSEMRGGRRDVELPGGGTKEMREIADSAAGLQESLRREEELRMQWTADIAHDLRTPLAVLKGQVEGMIDGVLDAGRPRLERNYREILNLERLVNQLADLTRIESPGYELDRAEVDAQAILAAQAPRFAEAARARGIAISVREGRIPPRRVQADASLLERALANLVDNAIRYAEPESEILLLAAMRGEGLLELTVDNAGLIDPADRPRVFDRLYRGDRSRSSPGSGIGLAVSLAIARAHGGSLRLESDEEARRTRFVLSLPA